MSSAAQLRVKVKFIFTEHVVSFLPAPPPWMCPCCSTSAHQLTEDKATPPSSSARTSPVIHRGERSDSCESALDFRLPVNGPRSASHRRHCPGGADASAPREGGREGGKRIGRE